MYHIITNDTHMGQVLVHVHMCVPTKIQCLGGIEHSAADAIVLEHVRTVLAVLNKGVNKTVACTRLVIKNTSFYCFLTACDLYMCVFVRVRMCGRTYTRAR